MVLTPARMIQMMEVEAFLMTIEQNKDANAPRRVMIRRPNWQPRTLLTQVFVFGLMGFQSCRLCSRLPHYTILVSIKAIRPRKPSDCRTYRVWVSVECYHRTLWSGSRRRRWSPARLRDSLWIEPTIDWAIEVVKFWTIVKEWRLRSPHSSD